MEIEKIPMINVENACSGGSTPNPLSQYQNITSVDECLADRVVVYPLTWSMGSPVGDAAAAAIVCSGR